MIENDFLSTDEEVKLREEVKVFVRSIDPELLRKMNKNEVEYPFEFLHEAVKRNSFGTSFFKGIWRKGNELDC